MLMIMLMMPIVQTFLVKIYSKISKNFRPIGSHEKVDKL